MGIKTAAKSNNKVNGGEKFERERENTQGKKARRKRRSVRTRGEENEQKIGGGGETENV